MNLLSFTFYTALGAGLWNIILALFGYLAHGQADLINKYSKELGYAIILVVALVLIYFLIRFLIRRKKEVQTEK